MNIQELNTMQLAFDNRNKLDQFDYAIRWEELIEAQDLVGEQDSTRQRVTTIFAELVDNA